MDENNKVYTLVAVFAVGDYSDLDQVWVAHFRTREDAVKALELKAGECRTALKVGMAGRIFDECLSTGCHHDFGDEGMRTRIYVRHEPVYESFDKEALSWS